VVTVGNLTTRPAGLVRDWVAPEVFHGDYEPEHSLGFYDITPDRQPA